MTLLHFVIDNLLKGNDNKHTHTHILAHRQKYINVAVLYLPPKNKSILLNELEYLRFNPFKNVRLNSNANESIHDPAERTK